MTLETAKRGQRAQLKATLGQAIATLRVADQHHFATIALHRVAAVLEIQLLVDQADRGEIVAPCHLGHQPMDPRLRPKSRWARRHLRNAENSEAFWNLGHPGARDHRVRPCVHRGAPRGNVGRLRMPETVWVRTIPKWRRIRAMIRSVARASPYGFLAVAILR